MTWPQAFAIFGVCIVNGLFVVAIYGMFRLFRSEDKTTRDILRASRDPAWKVGDKDLF